MTTNKLLSFTWNEDGYTNRFGEGVSRPKKGARCKLHNLSVENAGGMPMKVTLPAESKAAALRYARSRWPEASVSYLN